jgi:hypothetical protein
MGLTKNLGTLAQGVFSDSSLNIGIGGAPSGSFKFEVTGTGRFSGALTGTSATFANTTALGISTQTTAGLYNGVAASASGSSFFTKTGSLSTSFSSGFGVDGTYSSGLSIINLRAIGTQTAGGYASAMHFVLDNDGVQRNHAIFSSDGSTTLYGALSGTSAAFTGILTAGSSSSQTPASISTNSQANQPALTLFKNIFTGTGEDVFRIQSFTSGVVNVFTVKDNGATALSGALSGTSATFSSTATASAFIPSGASVPTNGMYLSAANTLDFATNSTNRLSISSAGEATFSGKIIATAPSSAIGLELRARSADEFSQMNFTNNAGSNQNGSIGVEKVGTNGGLMYFYTKPDGGTIAERMRIASNGSLLIGTSSTTNTSAGKIINRTSGTSNPDSSLNNGSWTNASIGGEPALYLSSNVVAATGAAGSSQTAKGGIGFEYYSSTSPTELSIGIFGTPTVASNLRFWNGTERMRITSGGNVLVGTTTDAGYKFQVNGQSNLDGYNLASSFQFTRAASNLVTPASGNGILVFAGGNAQMRMDTANQICFDMNNGGNPHTVLTLKQSDNTVSINSPNNNLPLELKYQNVASGYLGASGSALYAYSTNGGYVFLNASSVWIPASDAKRKRNFETYSNGLSAILGLQPKLYNMDFQKDGDEKQVGLVAQEVKDFIPKAYEDNNNFIGLNYNAIIVTMVNAIKELKAEIDILKNN